MRFRQTSKIQGCPQAADGLVGEKRQEIITAQSEKSYHTGVSPQARNPWLENVTAELSFEGQGKVSQMTQGSGVQTEQASLLSTRLSPADSALPSV